MHDLHVGTCSARSHITAYMPCRIGQSATQEIFTRKMLTRVMLIDLGSGLGRRSCITSLGIHRASTKKLSGETTLCRADIHLSLPFDSWIGGHRVNACEYSKRIWRVVFTCLHDLNC